MSSHQSIEHPAANAGDEITQGAAQDETTGRVLRDLRAASDLVENGAFDLAGQANNDTVSDMIRVVADLQMLIFQLSVRQSQ
ncbi:hypothetical protein HTT03_11205 [Sulfitobacter sp. S0837]|uniref:hypothetical protein n=1 Tax=Sulfitobacter maritimus TaxID=2741719 RepID=UPI0015828A34|nr:hypothetical protein [Sulfitobacter maritimus]NUH65851.1 hypothetical protein [Sulfitobacter maritimus]